MGSILEVTVMSVKVLLTSALCDVMVPGNDGNIRWHSTRLLDYTVILFSDPKHSALF